MKKRTVLILVAIFSLLLFSPFKASADIQNEIRAYLRVEAQTKTQKTIADLLGVSQGCVSAFIKTGSQTNSPTIVCNFQSKFPSIYQQFPSVHQAVVVVPPSQRVAPSPSLVPVPSLQAASTISFFSSPSSQTPFFVVDPNEGPLSVRVTLQTNAFVQRGIQAFQALNPSFLPCLPLQYRYAKGSSGDFMIEDVGEVGIPFEVRVFGPDFQGRFGWVAKGVHPLECFAVATKSEESRESLPVKYDVGCGYDGSHMLDCVHTPHPRARFTSNKDANNLFPQNPDGNRQFRRALTQEMGFACYRELYMYGENSLTLRQKRKRDFHKPRDRWLEEVISIPSGSIFLGFGNTGGKVYFLPENESGNTVSLYKTLYDQETARSPKATYATAVIPKFQVDNEDHSVGQFFCPYIYDATQPLGQRKMEFYRTLYIAINLNPFSSVGEGISLMRNMDIYFHWAAPRSDDISSLFSRWNYFRLPTLADTGELRWDNEGERLKENTGEKLIPAFSPVFSQQDIMRFRRYASESLMDQVVKSPLSTIKMKLGVAKKYLQEGKFEKAGALMRLAFLQIEKEGTIENALLLLRLYGDYAPQQFQEQALIKSLFSFVENRKAQASIETLVEIKRFNEAMKGRFPLIADNLEKVKSLTRANSTLLGKRVWLNDEMCACMGLLDDLTEIEEYSLQDVVFAATDNYWTTIMELDEEESIQDYVSHDDYFWKHERPFRSVMKTLEKHGKDLKRLNLRNLGFGLYTREDGRTSYRFDAPNVLRTLQVMQFSALEELHVTGFIGNSDGDAVTILENLVQYFPRLQRFYYSVDERVEYEIHRDDLPKLARVLRGQRDENEPS